MTDAVTYDIKGIKCDNADCDWCDMEAEFDPDYWLNKPCPECSANLFTRADYDTMAQMVLEFTTFNSAMAGVMHDDFYNIAHGAVTLDVAMDGSGFPKFSVVDED